MSSEKMPPEIRKEQIVEAALRELSDSSIKQLNIADIAKQMGLAPSALYRHFKNKNAMMSGVPEMIRTKLFHNVELVRQQSDDAIERLHKLLLRHGRLIAEGHGIPRIVFSDDRMNCGVRKKSGDKKCTASLLGTLPRLRPSFKEGQERGRLRNDIEARTLAAMFFGIVQPTALLWHMSDGQFDLDKHFAGAWKLFLETIIA